MPCAAVRTAGPIRSGAFGDERTTSDSAAIVRPSPSTIGAAMENAPIVSSSTAVAMPVRRTSVRICPSVPGRVIVRGVNLFPTQVEELVLKIAELAPHYQLVLTRTGHLDELEVLTEVRSEFDHLSGADRDKLAERLQQSIKAYIGVTARVQVMPSGSVERTLTGKARRVIDKRPR